MSRGRIEVTPPSATGISLPAQSTDIRRAFDFEHEKMSDMPASERLIIFDTTLRDGEQSPGASMNLAEKLEMAHALKDLGVDVIEAGFPIASPGDFEAVRRIAHEVHGPQIAGLARCNPGDIDRAWEALKGSPKPRLHVFLATSAIPREYKLRMTPQEIVARADLLRRHPQLVLAVDG